MEPNLLKGNIIVVIVWLSDKLKLAQTLQPLITVREVSVLKVFMVVI